MDLQERLARLTPRQRAALEERLGTSGRSGAIERRFGAGDAAPLSFVQSRLWFIDQLDPGNPAYNIAWAERIDGPLDADAMGAAFDALLQRHPVLRTAFPSDDGAPVQQVLPDSTAVLELIDLTTTPPAERPAAAEQIAVTHARQRFDLAHGPLIAAKLLRLDPDRHHLLVTVHHTIADRRSVHLLFHDLLALYGDRPLPELDIGYADYAAWQRDRLTPGRLDQDLAYWRQQLADLPDTLDLPTDRPRPPVSSFNGRRHTFTLDPAVHDLARRHQSTPFLVLLTALQAVLARYTGHTDIPVGTPVSTRGHSQLDNLIGPFLNTLVLRGDLSGDPSFAELLRRNRETFLDAHTHAGLPFETLADQLTPTRNLARNPLFQVLLTYHSAEAGPQGDGAHTRTPLNIDPGTALVDLDLYVEEAGDELICVLHYATDLFDHDRMERLAGHYRTLLAAATADPGSPISRLPYLTEAERHQSLVETNSTKRDYPRQCVHELVAAQASRTPGSTAIVGPDETPLTYAELERQAGRLAGRLRRQGVGPGTCVAVCLPRDAGLVIALLAIWKAGGYYLPLDPDYPTERFRYLLEDSAAGVVLTDSRLAARLPETRIAVISLDGWAGDEDEHLPVATPGQPAYLIYTSGSTGRPKGVLVPHRGLSSLIWDVRREPGLGEGDGYLFLTSLSFDIAAMEIFAPLATGGTVVIAPDTVQHTVDHVRALVEDGRLTTLQATPSALEVLLPALGAGVPRIISTGEALPLPLAQRLLNVAGELWDLYGPTETTIWSCRHRVPPDVTSPSIGRPVANTSVHVLDAEMEPVPVGVPGELFIGGDGVAHGYWNRPALTAERFVPDPFGRPGDRLYRTGDLVRRESDGTLRYLGRLDDQVKVRGVRIELGEVTAALAGHPQVRRAAVAVREDAPGGRGLVAYVDWAGDPGALTADLRAHLRESLPEPMIPSAYVAVRDFPVLPSGKLDRAALPPPTATGTGSPDHVPPRSPLEERLSGLWAELLNRDRVGVTDDFFELGGHSLLAVQLMARIRETFDVEIQLRHCFEAPSVAGLARVIRDAPLRPGGTIERRFGAGDAAPLSFAQSRLWFIDQLDPGNPAYNIAWAERIDGPLDPAKMAAAFDALTERHPALRTVFPSDDGEPVQLVQPVSSAKLEFTDLSAQPPDEGARAAAEIARGHARQRFDLARGPLVAATLQRLAPERHHLLLTLHHTTADRWSLSILIRDLLASYGGRPLPEPPIGYADYAAWQREHLTPAEHDRHLAYWKNQLADLPDTLDLPADRPRPAISSFNGRRHTFTLGADIRRWARDRHSTPFLVLLSGLQALLARYTGHGDIPIGTPASTRSHPRLDQLVGPFLNTLVLRGDVTGDPSFAQLLQRNRETLLDAHTHAELPFEILADQLTPSRNLARNPLFQVLLTYQHGQAIAAEELELTPLDIDPGVAQVDLQLMVEEAGDELICVLHYATDLFDQDRIERLAEHYRTLLASALAGPDTPLSRLPLLTEAEEALIVAANQTDRAYPRSTYVPASTSDEVGRLAARLAGSGAGADRVVGVCLERGPELVTAVHAVLAAGGAYLPLEPDHPADRLAYMISDARADLVVTTSDLADRLPHVRLVLLDDEERAIEEAPALAAPHPDSLAYVIYTSGSTGRPKGVGVSHRALANRLQWMQETFPLTPDDRVLHKTPFGFDVSVWELCWPPAVGASLTIASPGDHRDPKRLADLIADEAVTTVHFVPSMLDAFLDEPDLASRMTTVRRIICSGEALHPALVERTHNRLPHIELHNLYGPTEAAIDVTWHPCQPGENTIPIGRPIANTRVEILDSHLNRVPIGATGELHIGGVQLARGYLHNPAMTADRFLPDPYGPPGSRLYRTGDRARWLFNGELEYLGRTDQQTKVRGMRVEPGEIEAVLLDQPEIHAAAVTATGDQLTAYLVLTSGSRPVDWRNRLRRTLPDHMIPAHWVTLDALPLAPNGKLDRKALPPPQAAAHVEYQAPAGDAEQAVAKAWSSVLDLDRVSMHDNFFAVGGDSIRSLKMLAQLRSAGYRVELQDLFLHQTAGELADALEAAPVPEPTTVAAFGLLSPEDRALLGGDQP